MDIDDIDFSVLKVASQSEEPLWKKQVHRRIAEDIEGLPEVKKVSVQTIGRRIDRLHEAGLLEPTIITPEKINRDLIIAYSTTDRGEEVLGEKRESILRECAAATLLYGEETPYSCDLVSDLVCGEIGVSDETLESLVEQDPTYLAILISCHYLKNQVEDCVRDDHVDTLRELAAVDRNFAETVSGSRLSLEVRKAIR